MRKPSLAIDFSALLAYARGVPMTLDEAQRKWGRDVYDVMRRDAAVNAGLRKWKQEVLSEEFRLVPPLGFEEDQAVLDECKFIGRGFDRLDSRIEDISWQMLDAGAEGHVLTEVTWMPGEGQDRGLDVFESLRPIPHDLYVIVQDAYGKFLGAIGWVPGHVPVMWEGPILMPLESIPGFIPAWKFALLTHDAKIGGLMGRSRLEAAYNAYAVKYRTWALFLQYLVRFAGPIPVGEVSPDAQVRDPLKTPEQEMGEFLSQLEEMAAAGVPAGTNLKFLTVAGGEKTFVEAIKACDQQIVTAILGNPRSMMEAEHSSKADGDNAQDSVDEDTAFTASQLCAVINRQIIRPLVRSNRGPDFPCPILTLAADPDDFADNSVGVAAMYTSGAVADNQEAALAKKWGGPAPDVPWSVRRQQAQPQVVGPDGKPVQKPREDPKPGEKDKKASGKTSFWQIPWSSRRAA
jgi:hypothetical protein